MILIFAYFALGFLIDLAVTSLITFASAITSIRQQLKDLGLSASEVLGKMLTGQASIGVSRNSKHDKPSSIEYIVASFIQFLSFGIASFIYFHVLPTTNLASSILLGAAWGSIYAGLQVLAHLINNFLDKVEPPTAKDAPAKTAEAPSTTNAIADEPEEAAPRTVSPWDISDVILFFATPVIVYLIFFLS